MRRSKLTPAEKAFVQAYLRILKECPDSMRTAVVFAFSDGGFAVEGSCCEACAKGVILAAADLLLLTGMDAPHEEMLH